MDSSLQLQILMENYSKLETKLEEMNEKYNLQQKQIQEILELQEQLQESTNSRELHKSDNSQTSNYYNSPKRETISNNLSIVFSQYKKSILVLNMYSDKNSTQNFKQEFKDIDARWFTNNELDLKGWLFVGKLRGTLEESSKSIIDHFEKICVLEYEFNH